MIARIPGNPGYRLSTGYYQFFPISFLLLFKGEYFSVNPPENMLVKGLICAVPHLKMEGFGIHVAIDMGGGVDPGPDVKYLESNVCNYKLTASMQEVFYIAAEKFLPFLEYDDITPEMAGIRPKIQKPGELQCEGTN